MLVWVFLKTAKKWVCIQMGIWVGLEEAKGQQPL